MSEILKDQSQKSPEKKTKSELRAAKMAEYILSQVPPKDERDYNGFNYETPAYRVPGKPNLILPPRIDDVTLGHLKDILSDEELTVSPIQRNRTLNANRMDNVGIRIRQDRTNRKFFTKSPPSR